MTFKIFWVRHGELVVMLALIAVIFAAVSFSKKEVWAIQDQMYQEKQLCYRHDNLRDYEKCLGRISDEYAEYWYDRKREKQ